MVSGSPARLAPVLRDWNAMNDVVGRYDVQPEGALISIALDTTFHYAIMYACKH